jgi:thiamine monophosphate kinase
MTDEHAAHSSSQKTEFDFIDSLRERVASASLKSESLIAGIGDDAAVFRGSAGKETVITADLLVELPRRPIFWATKHSPFRFPTSPRWGHDRSGR